MHFFNPLQEGIKVLESGKFKVIESENLTLRNLSYERRGKIA